MKKQSKSNAAQEAGSLDRQVRHELKTWPEYFRKIKSGEKTFEIRETNDRTFSVGDLLLLREFAACSRCNGSGRCDWDAWDRGPCDCNPPHGRYTGAKLEMRIQYITDFGQPEGQVVMAIVPNGLMSRATPKKKALRRTRLARSGGSAQALHEINWMLIGSTDAYSELKKDIAHVCRDVTHAACIDEICVSDIVQTFKKHGYAVVPSATSNCDAGHGLAGAPGYLKEAHQGNDSGAGAPLTFPPVLDVCCGPKHMWFRKDDPLAMFADVRQERIRLGPIRKGAKQDIEIAPDVIADFRKMPFPNECFRVVVFDPPHLTQGSVGGFMAAVYGALPMDWKNAIAAGFSECFRVLVENGVLVFKWNECRIGVDKILALSPYRPLFGNRCSAKARSHWIVFLKHAGAVAPAPLSDNGLMSRRENND